MAFLDHYVAIQKIRFGEQLKIETHISPEVKYASVPSLFVQPLVENAIRHGISKQSAGGTVVISARRVDEQLEIRIIDDGVGLPPGWTMETSNGLGLSVTRERIAGLHANGSSHFALRRREDGGTEVEISLPLRMMDEEANGRASPEPICVLVADDEAPARQRLIDLLQRDPMVAKILTAANGETAVEVIESQHPDLIFLDIQMPELDGLGVVDAVGPAANAADGFCPCLRSACHPCV